MNFLEKILNALGIYEYVEEDDKEERGEKKTAPVKKFEEKPKIAAVPVIEPRNVKQLPAPGAEATSGRGNVINLPPANKQVSVMLVKPRIFDDAQIIADHIKAARPVVINFENADDQVKKRITDFISGTIYALNGRIKMVGDKTMIGAPSNVDIEELAANGDLNWRR